MIYENLFLLRGKSLKLSDELSVKHPTLDEISEVGHDKYMEHLFSLVSTSLDVADILLFEMNVWYEDIKDEWIFFLQKCLSNSGEKKDVALIAGEKIYRILEDCLFVSESYRDALNYFLGLEGEYIILERTEDNTKQTILYNAKYDENKNLYIDDKSIKFTRHFYELTSKFLRDSNWVTGNYDFTKGGNMRAKRYMLKMMYNDRKKKKKPSINLDSIVSALIVKMQDPQKIWDCPIYTIYDMYYRLNRIQEYNNTVMGYYSGSFDTSKTPINWEKINWSGIINN